MLVIRVIGELEVVRAGTKAELPGNRRAQALLGWLAIHPGRHSRSRLAGRFWPDVPDASARASLRSAIWALRSALGPDFRNYLTAGRDAVMLAGDGLSVDVLEVGRLIAGGQPEAALDLCRGELLREFDDDWVFEAREDFDDRVAAAMKALVGAKMAAGDSSGAVAWARRHAALRPLDESAGMDLMTALASSGDVAGALEAHHRLAHRLDSELGISVSPDVSALARSLRDRARPRGQSGQHEMDHADREVAPASRPSARLVGRDAEFSRLRAAWQAARTGSGTAVLLEGEGGIGKTRLAEELQAAARDAGAVVAGGTSAGPGMAPPFGLWSEALIDLASWTGLPPDEVTWTQDLARVVPAFARQDGRTIRRVAAEPQLERVRFCEAVVQFLAWAARDRALVLTLEDLHLADSSSLELLGYACRRIIRLPALLVLTRRRLPPRQDLDAVLGAVRSRGALGAEIDVRPLPAADVRTLARASADLPTGRSNRSLRSPPGAP